MVYNKPQDSEAQEMEISVTEAKAQLTDLVRRAEAGEEVVLTRHGHPVVRIAPIKAVQDKQSRLAIIERFQREARDKILPGPGAAESQDFLYDEYGLPK
jgi:prevent-host-death family protein